MTKIDLLQLTNGEVFMLTGAPRGVQARVEFGLDDLELGDDDDVITFSAPADLDTITPSFVQGFLARSVQNLGVEKFSSKFDFSRLPEHLIRDFKVGIERLTMRANGNHHSVLSA